MTLFHQHLLSAEQLTPDVITEIFGYVMPDEHDFTRLAGKTVACLFYEPSTRTSSSFIAAVTQLGGGVIPITQGVQYSSVSKR